MLILATGCGKESTPPPQPSDGSTTEIAGTAIAPETTLCGLVADASTGIGIPGVVVSDGFTCVRTDANGVYQIVRERSHADCVYVTLPAEYAVPVTSDNHPAFYKKIDMAAAVCRRDFALEPLPGGKEKRFALLCIADPQCRNDRSVARFREESIPDIDATARLYDNVYALTLGDITDNNKTDLWNKMKASMSNREVVFFQCMGNHDHLNESNRDVTTTYWKSIENYRKYFGPQNYGLKGSIVANVWNIEPDGWDVSLWQNGAKVCDMTRFREYDWWVAYWLAEVYGGDGLNGRCDHLWKGALADPDAPFEVRAVDRSGRRGPYVATSVRRNYKGVWGEFDMKTL